MGRDSVQDKVEAARKQLEQGLAKLQTSDDWRRTLELMALLGPTRISRFSFNNLLLMAMQRDGIRHAATFNAWRKKGRMVRAGEKGLVVLRPRFRKLVTNEGKEEQHLAGFSYLTVFALEQTDGPALPEPVMPQDFVTPEGWTHTVEKFRELALKLPHVSGIELRERREGDPSAYGWYNRTTKGIVVLTDSTPGQQFATLAHELAHAILHGADDHHDTATKEVEAESTAFVVCHALGLDTSNFTLPYVARWAQSEEPTKAVAAAGERIRKASAQMLEILAPQPALDDIEAPEATGPTAAAA